jgi:hypothetical protein
MKVMHFWSPAHAPAEHGQPFHWQPVRVASAVSVGSCISTLCVVPKAIKAATSAWYASDRRLVMPPQSIAASSSTWVSTACCPSTMRWQYMMTAASRLAHSSWQAESCGSCQARCDDQGHELPWLSCAPSGLLQVVGQNPAIQHSPARHGWLNAAQHCYWQCHWCCDAPQAGTKTCKHCCRLNTCPLSQSLTRACALQLQTCGAASVSAARRQEGSCQADCCWSVAATSPG